MTIKFYFQSLKNDDLYKIYMFFSKEYKIYMLKLFIIIIIIIIIKCLSNIFL